MSGFFDLNLALTSTTDYQGNKIFLPVPTITTMTVEPQPVNPVIDPALLDRTIKDIVKEIKSEYQASLPPTSQWSPPWSSQQPVVPTQSCTQLPQGPYQPILQHHYTTPMPCCSQAEPTITMFGITLTGQRPAFILDASGSMGHKKRMDIVKNQLINAIDSLHPSKQFYVTFYNTSHKYPEISKWINRSDTVAVDEIKTLIMEKAINSGGTDPIRNFEHIFGLAQKPDELLFLTDGQFSKKIIDRIKELNIDNIRIHCVTVGVRTMEPEMMELAAATGGQYKHIPDTENESTLFSYKCR